MKTDGELAGRLIDSALKAGASLAEVYEKSARRLSAEVNEGTVEAVETSLSFGYSLRVIVEGRPGFSYSNDSSEWQSVVESALASAKWAEMDENLDFPAPAAFGEALIFDPRVEEIINSPDEAVKMALSIEIGAKKDKRVTRLRKPTASFSISGASVYNSRGIEAFYKASSCAAQVMAVAEESGESQMGWDFEGSRLLSEVGFERVGGMAAERALRLLGSRKISALKTDVALEHSVAVEFLGIFSSLLSADAVQKGKSLLKGKKGQDIISESLSVIDDGLLPGKLGSRPFDDEGVPTSRKTLIERGTLGGYMYNTYTANKDKVKSTGNAVRGGFSGTPSVGPTNLYVESHNKVNDVIAALGKGLFITDAMGVHMANPVSGHFSIGVSGLWVEGGKAVFPVKEAVISGNILEFFGAVRASGGETVFYGNMGSPSLIAGPVDISA